MKIIILLLVMMIPVSGVHAFDSFRFGVGYTSGISILPSWVHGTDNIKYKAMPAGMILDFSFSINKRFGVGFDINFAYISRITVSDNNSNIHIDDWSGILTNVNLSLYFYMTSFTKNKALFQLAFGPSFTSNLYFSQYATAFDENYLGFSMKAQFAIPIRNNIDLALGCRTTLDFFGFWNAALINDFFQIHFFPFLSTGIKY